MKFVSVLAVVGLAAADPTRFLVQNAEVKPHSASFAQVSSSEVQRLRAKAEASKKVFLAAMQKLQDDENRFQAESKEFAEKARDLHKKAHSTNP